MRRPSAINTLRLVSSRHGRPASTRSIVNVDRPALRTAAGCEVVCAASAPAALAALAESRFDLVLCERRMPFREGSPLAAELTRRLPDGRCAMTSDEPLEALAAEGIARGWSEVLARPA